MKQNLEELICINVVENLKQDLNTNNPADFVYYFSSEDSQVEREKIDFVFGNKQQINNNSPWKIIGSRVRNANFYIINQNNYVAPVLFSYENSMQYYSYKKKEWKPCDPRILDDKQEIILDTEIIIKTYNDKKGEFKIDIIYDKKNLKPGKPDIIHLSADKDLTKTLIKSLENIHKNYLSDKGEVNRKVNWDLNQVLEIIKTMRITDRKKDNTNEKSVEKITECPECKTKIDERESNYCCACGHEFKKL
ncbi:Uncharacterised protein [Candidatus Tiddalikarchaeum anstoanum]|nr:Uncharacterised protein [Candidatus Tiddalikarchaeum anstoanum]